MTCGASWIFLKRSVSVARRDFGAILGVRDRGKKRPHVNEKWNAWSARPVARHDLLRFFGTRRTHFEKQNAVARGQITKMEHRDLSLVAPPGATFLPNPRSTSRLPPGCHGLPQICQMFRGRVRVGVHRYKRCQPVSDVAPGPIGRNQ